MGTHRGTDDVEGVLGVTAPVSDGLTTGIAQGHVTCAYRMHLGPQHLHTFYVGVLALHVGGTHKHLTLQVHQRTDRSSGYAMLSGTCLCDDARLTHLLGQQNLTDGVVDLVGTGMVQVLTLQIESTAVLFTHSLGIVQGRGSSYIVF